MGENEGIRIVSLFVGMLLCTALMQTACAAWNVPDWNANTGNVTSWNATTENKTTENTAWGPTDGSLPPSDLMNAPVQSSNFVNVPKFSDLLSDSSLRNGMQLPRIQRR
jgi:hypothetical protein